MKRTIAAAAAWCAVIAGFAFAMPAHAQVYWRLDVGWSKTNGADFQDKDFLSNGVICGDAACTAAGKVQDIDDSYLAGLGIGYRWSPSFRGDATLTYRGAYKLNGSDGSGAAFRSDITSTALMGNVYYDFAAGSVKPYVGLGFGYAWNQMDQVVQTFPGGTITTPGGRKGGTAGAFMAGIGIPLSGTLVLDIGYRFTDLGRIKSESGTGSGNIAGVPFSFAYSGADGKLTANEVTIGLRF